MVTLRILEPSDAPLLLRWLTDPRVLEYWEGPHEVFTPKRIREDFYEDPDPTTRCIVQYGGRDIGYLQFYPLDSEGFREYQYDRTDLLAFGIDQFIGEPELWGRGIGREFVRLICEYLRDSCGAQAIVLDPHADNPRAIRLYEKFGFVRIGHYPGFFKIGGEYFDCELMNLYL